MSKSPPDPSPPPKRTAEDRKFFDLLKKLVQVPKGEVDALEAQRQKRSRKGPRGAARPKRRQG
jgi:hypothetical protein